LSSREWNKTLESFLNIKKMADEIGAKTILIFFPQRGNMYYEKATGNKLPIDNYEALESRCLRSFADKEGIFYIDTSEIIINYVNSLDTEAKLNFYPYLEMDGHLSAAGNKLIADELYSYIKKLRKISPKN